MREYVPLRVVPLELRDANAFILERHRHHGRAQGHRWSLGVIDPEGWLRGCAVMGRPTSGLDPSRVLEVTRMCTDDDTPNGCSMLYGAAARAARAMGFEVIQTYIYKRETGISLRAAGWQFVRDAHPSGRSNGRSDGQPRDTTHVDVQKTLWRKQLNGTATEFHHHRRTVLL
jgi:hypothetical protein